MGKPDNGQVIRTHTRRVRAQSNPPAVILGGSANAVSVARSLGRAGITVYALGGSRSSVRYSRYCHAYIEFGFNRDIAGSWLEWLGRGPRGAVVLPCDDHGVQLVAEHRATLLELGYRPVEADDDVLLAMLDKDRTYAVARSIGVPTPQTVTVRSADAIEDFADDLSYPCVLKPLHSHVFRHRLGTNAKVVTVSDRTDLENTLSRLLGLGIEMMVTEVIPGGNDRYSSYYSYIDEHGEPLFSFTKRKLRGYPVQFGLWCYQVTDWDPEVARAGLRFFQAVGLRGMGNVEFKRDPRDGQLKLIECNPRFTASNNVLRIAGIDLASIAYNRLTGRPVPPLGAYRTGVRLWNPVEDARALLVHRREGDLSFPQWVRTLLHRQHFPVFDAADPMPTIGYHAYEARRLARKLWRWPRSLPARRDLAAAPNS